MSDIVNYIKLIKEYSKDSYPKLTREPMKRLKHPFIVPGPILIDGDHELAFIKESKNAHKPCLAMLFCSTT